MKTIIAGSRNVPNVYYIAHAIELCRWEREITTVVSGAARGADKFGEQWAKERNIPIDPYPVTSSDWERLGKSAGYKRNEVMADNADALIAVWDGKSKGTKNMIDIAERKGLAVFVYMFDPVTLKFSGTRRIDRA